MGLFLQELSIPNIILSANVVYSKGSRDILQGINKLDYLLKVSIFQKFVNPAYNRSNSIISDDTKPSESASSRMYQSEFLNERLV